MFKLLSFFCIKKIIRKLLLLYRHAKKGESLKYQPGVKPMKAPYITVADIEALLRKMDTCANDPSKSSTEKKNEH